MLKADYKREYPILRALKKEFAPASEDDVSTVEARLGVAFPPEFRQFLIAVNGGAFATDYIVDPNPSVPYTGPHGVWRCTIQSLMSIADRTHPDSILACFYDLRNRIPHGLIPIATVHSSCLLISTRNQDYGAIYFLDRTFEVAQTPEQNIKFVTDSFNQFLSQLEFVDDD